MAVSNETRAVVKGDGPPAYSPHCPKCFERLDLQAVVSDFMKPDGWQFYGEKGQRFIRCKANEYIHFKVNLSNGKTSHRMAWFER